MAEQTHLKVVLINSVADESVQVVQFENSFEVDKLAAAMEMAGRGQPPRNWNAACDEYMREYRLEDLTGQG